MHPTFIYETELQQDGRAAIAGIDEAGRGALAGPVVAAAVILDGKNIPSGIRDSKLIPEAEREVLYDLITTQAVAWSVGIIHNIEIDRINILQATFRAMISAAESLRCRPDYLLIDGRDVVDAGCQCRAIVKGDGVCLSIAAASIIAKVTRDRIMRELHTSLPHYAWNTNKGYGTADHRRAILTHGPSQHHRVSFLGKLMQERLVFE